MSSVENFDHAGLRVRIDFDDDPPNPCTEWDQAGVMVCFHSRYDLGHVGGRRRDCRHEYDGMFDTPQDFLEWWKENGEGGVLLPLALIDHSGLSMWVGNGPSPCDPGGWDSGQVGWIFATRETILKEWGHGKRKRVTKKMREDAEACLRAEVSTYDDYLTGQCFGYVVEDEDGCHIDSCWGIYGVDYCREEAKSAAECASENMAIGAGI